MLSGCQIRTVRMLDSHRPDVRFAPSGCQIRTVRMLDSHRPDVRFAPSGCQIRTVRMLDSHRPDVRFTPSGCQIRTVRMLDSHHPDVRFALSGCQIHTVRKLSYNVMSAIYRRLPLKFKINSRRSQEVLVKKFLFAWIEKSEKKLCCKEVSARGFLKRNACATNVHDNIQGIFAIEDVRYEKILCIVLTITKTTVPINKLNGS